MATFQNQATLTYNGNVINSNITTGQVIDVLSITKTCVTDTYTLNDSLTYIISIVNSGTNAYNNMSISDNLGEYTAETNTLIPLNYVSGSLRYYINGATETPPTINPGPPLVVSGINVPANGSAMIMYEVTVNQFAPINVGGNIVNTTELTGAGITTALTAQNTVNAVEAPNLTITKSVSPSTVNANGQLTYSFIIQNYGNTAATAVDNVIVTDTFDPLLSNLNVTFSTLGTSVNWVEPTNYTYTDATGVFTSVTGQITVPQATYTQDPDNGSYIINPGVSVLTIAGTLV